MLNVLFPWSHCVKIEVKTEVIVTIKMIKELLFLNGHRTLWFSSDSVYNCKTAMFCFLLTGNLTKIIILTEI